MLAGMCILSQNNCHLKPNIIKKINNAADKGNVVR